MSQCTNSGGILDAGRSGEHSRAVRPAIGLDENAQRTQTLAVIKQFYPYNAFVDESCQSRYGGNVFSVAAYIGVFERWLKFEEEWRGILRRFEVPLDGKEEHTQSFFHTTDFLARQKQFQNAWTDEKRDEFMERLTTTASEYTSFGVACCVVQEEFAALPDDFRDHWREPYYFCLWGILSLLLGWEERFPIAIPKPLWFLFDRRKKAVEFASHIFYEVKATKDPTHILGDMAFGEMWRTPQLQAADLLVYEATRHRLERDYNLSESIRKSLDRLNRKKNLLIVYLNREHLDRYVRYVREARSAEPPDLDD